MAAMTPVAAIRTAARARRCTGTREMSSTVSSKARGGQAAMVWLMRLSRACRTFAAIEAATPSVRASRTRAQPAGHLVLDRGDGVGAALGGGHGHASVLQVVVGVDIVVQVGEGDD